MSSKVVSLKSEHECEDETVEEGSRAPEEASLSVTSTCHIGADKSKLTSHNESHVTIY